jgi:hypothetical protein
LEKGKAGLAGKSARSFNTTLTPSPVFLSYFREVKAELRILHLSPLIESHHE